MTRRVGLESRRKVELCRQGILPSHVLHNTLQTVPTHEIAEVMRIDKFQSERKADQVTLNVGGQNSWQVGVREIEKLPQEG